MELTLYLALADSSVGTSVYLNLHAMLFLKPVIKLTDLRKS